MAVPCSRGTTCVCVCVCVCVCAKIGVMYDYCQGVCEVGEREGRERIIMCERDVCGEWEERRGGEIHEDVRDI